MKKYLLSIFSLFVFAGLSFGANISGKIANWDPDTEGNFLVVASTNPNDPGSSIASSTNVFCPAGGSANYTLTGLSDGTYYIFALLDLNSNMNQEPNEPSGSYEVFNSTTGPEPVVIFNGASVSDIDFVCMSQQGPYLLRGLIRDEMGTPLQGAIVNYERYSVQYDTTSTLLYPTSPSDPASTTSANVINTSIKPQYIPDYNWEIVIDTTLYPNSVGYDGEFQRIFVSSAPYGDVEQWIWFSTDTESGLFFETILSTSGGAAPPPSSFGDISGQISYSGSYSGDLYIAYGHGDPSTWSAGPDYQNNEGLVSFPYNYYISSVPVANDYYVYAYIDVNGDGMPDSSTEPTGQFGPVTVIDGTTTPNIDFSLYDPAGGGNGVGGTTSISFENVSVNPQTITPDGDGIDDEFTINYVVKSTVSQTDVNIKIIVDVNGNDKPDPFDWNKVIWDNYGDITGDYNAPSVPHYIEISTSDYWAYYNGLTYDEKKALEISYEELDALQFGRDLEYWDWIPSSDMTSSTTSEYKANRSFSINLLWEAWRGAIPSNGPLKLFIYADAPYWDESDGISASTEAVVNVEGVGEISGTVKDSSGNLIKEARVEISGPNIWLQVYTSTTGYYSARGLKLNESYHIRVSKKGYSSYEEDFILNSSSETKDITLSKGIKVSGNIILPAPYTPEPDQWGYIRNELWGWVNGWSINSPQNDWTDFRISSGVQNAQYTLYLAPGTYEISAGAEGYVSISTRVYLSQGTTYYNLNLKLEKSVKITGTVEISPTAVSSNWRYINVNARSLDDEVYGWGNAQIEPWKSSATFTVWNIFPNKKYELKFYSDYFIEESTIVTVASSDLNLPNPVTLSTGATLSGEVVVNWSRRASEMYQNWRYSNGTKDVIGVDLEVFDPDKNLHRHTFLEVPYVSTTSFSGNKLIISTATTFEVRGLAPSGNYLIEAWELNRGFENKNKFQKFSISTTSIKIEFVPFSGRIIGQLSENTTAWIKYANLWDDQFESEPLFISNTNYFEINELPTGEYVLGIFPENPDAAAVVYKRARVANGQTTDLGEIKLPSPSKISGTLVLNSNKYPDWNVVSSTASASGERLEVRALLVGNIMRYGPEGAYEAATGFPIRISTSDATIATFEIKGLGAGNYVIVPPIYFDSSNDQSDYDATRDLACSFPFVPLSEGEQKDIGIINMSDGYKVKFAVSRTETTGEAWYEAEIQSRENFMPATPHKPVIFNSGQRTTTVEFSAISPGKYNLIIRIHDQKYKNETIPFEVVDKDVDLGTINLSKGANIKGKIVDAETGEILYDGIRAHCVAEPYVEGSWRETADINDEWADPDTKISSTTGKFKLKNLPAGTYRVVVEDYNDRKPYKYAPYTIHGVVVPDQATDVDIGTIKLKKGKNISGTVKDEDGSPLSNIKVEAEPMSGQIETWAEAFTDANGKFVLKGLDPDVEYWRIIAAPRPEAGERDEDISYYVQSVKKNVKIGEENLEFILTKPNVEKVTGIIAGPVANSKDEYEIVSPWGEEGIKQYGALVILQRKGEIYSDPLAGYQVISQPPYWDSTENRWKTKFTITDLKDGIYNLRVMAKGFRSIFVEDINIPAGEEISLGTTTLSTGATLTGKFYHSDMTKVKTTEVNEVVAATPDLREIVFGTLNSNDSTKEIESFEIKGLSIGKKYSIVLPKTDDSVFFAPDIQFIKNSTQTYSPNGYFIFKDNPPFFVSSINKISSDTVKIRAWITEPIRETDGSDVLILDGVFRSDGSSVTGRSFENIKISPDKTEVSAEFKFAPDETSIKFHYEGTDYNGNKQQPSNYPSGKYPFSFTYYKGWDTVVQGNVNPLTGGTVSVGNGDNSEVYAPSGSFEGDETVNVTVSKTEYSTQTARGVMHMAPSMVKALYGKPLPSLSKAPGTIASSLYQINAYLLSGPLATIASGSSVKVTLEYDTNTITQSDIDNHLVAIYSSTDGSSDWTVVGSTWPEIDTVNHTISAEANHFTYFAVFKTNSPPDFSQKSNPQITKVEPNSGKQGETLTITVTGSDFESGASVSISGTGVTVTSTTVKSSTEISATINISSTAATGKRNVTVTNPDGAYYTLADGFIVSDKNISITQVSDDINSGTSIEVAVGKTLTLKITGTGLSVFGDNTNDTITLDNKAESYSIKGTISTSTANSLTANFSIPDSAPLGTYDLILYDADNDNYATLSGAVVFKVSQYTEELKAYVYPNPVTDGNAYIKVAIPGTLGEETEVKVKVYNLAGEEVWSKTATLKKGYGPGDLNTHYSGENTIQWNCTNNGGEKLASGVYFYIIEVEGQKLKGKLAIIK